jgi:asparagine synthase (glutamine-hydrolysing)
MCGLWGHYSLLSFANADELQSRLLSAQIALHHRGPDDRGLEEFTISPDSDHAPRSLFMGHTRLSIIDLTAGGHQPMRSADGRYTVVFNGEIYNYRELRAELQIAGYNFDTDSDTEVLLASWAHWGLMGLRRFTGMFAFVIYDHLDQSLTLVRDAFGIKPLFFALDRDIFSFASELPALLALIGDKPALNLQQAYDYLVFGSYDDQTCTFYQNVSQLPPAHWLRLDLKTLQSSGAQRWWWPSIEERTDLTFEEAAAELREIFLNSVRLHLRSDVPLGAALSGGVDSSAVVCSMRHLDADMPIHTFSFISPGSRDDEERWADVVNSHVGAIAHKVVVAPQDLGDDLDDMIKVQAEPFGGTSIYAQYRVFRLAREAAITVTLDGQGADELLAGYQGFPQGYIGSLLDYGRYKELFHFLRAWSSWPGRGARSSLKALCSAAAPLLLLKFARRIIGPNTTPKWLDIGFLAQNGVKIRPPQRSASSVESRGRRLMEHMRNALTVSSLPTLLRHGDRNSMRWSVESRVPFLTIDIAEFLLSLPESYLLSPQGQTKRIFRAAMRGIVPDEILDRRDKIGFQTPERAWLCAQREALKPWLSMAANIPFLREDACQAEVNQILNGDKPFSAQAWRLINFCRWVQTGLDTPENP